MKKIEKLTRAQEKKLPVYLNKWLSNGRKTTRINKKKAKEAIATIYKCAGLDAPKYYFFFPSPIQCQLAVNLMKTKEFEGLLKESNLWSNLESNLWSNLRSNLGSNLGSNLRSNLGSNLELNLRSNLWSNLRSNLGSNLGSNLESNLWSNLESNLELNLGSNLESNLWSNLGSNLGSNLWSNLRSNLRSNLWSNLRSNLGSNLGSNLWSNLESNLELNLWSNLESNLELNLWSNLESNLVSNLVSNLELNLVSNLVSNLGLKYENIFWGNHWVGWVGFYDFILNELFESEIKKYKSFMEYCEALKHVHLFIPYKEIVFISDNPKELHLNSEGRLHADLKPAMMYSDGYSLFYLNGIKIPKEVIEKKPQDLKREDLTKETNADVRREIIRKIGSNRLLSILDYKVLDKTDEYELINFDIGDGRVRPFLKMTCPSTKLTHIEGVKPEITKVKEALAFKFGVKEWKRPLIET